MSKGRRGRAGGVGGGSGRFPWGGVILVLLGVLFLLNTLGVLPWGWWSSLMQLWPVLLVLAGVYLLWGRARPMATAIAMGVIIVAAIGVAALAGTIPLGRSTPETFWEPLSGVTRAKVDVNFGAGDLTITSLPAGTDRLVEGEFEGRGGGQRVVRELRTRDNTAELRIESGTKGSFSWFRNGFNSNGELRLAPEVPMDLAVTAGASSARLDLTDLRISNLQLDLGASKANVFLPKPAGTARAVVKAGAADIDLIVPPKVAARVAVDSGLSRVKVDLDRFTSAGGFYVTQDYDQATDRLEIVIQVGVANVNVR
ncbi:MAG: hypothetical protein HYY01_11325 [Chloroflexi bacterium]|nr:hypothetical protein [Chloroflexota bacterium]